MNGVIHPAAGWIDLRSSTDVVRGAGSGSSFFGIALVAGRGRFLLSHNGNAAFLLYQKCHTLIQIQDDPWQFAQRDVPPLQMAETAPMLNSSRN